MKINYRRYYKVVTKLLKRANIGTATERLQSSVIKKRSSMEKYLKYKEVNISSIFLNPINKIKQLFNK